MNYQNHIGIRNTFRWGTRGKNLDQEIQYVLLKDIDNEHLENIIKWIKTHTQIYNEYTINLMETEKKYRLKQIRQKKLKLINEK